MQNQKNKPWRNKEFKKKKLEEDLPRLKNDLAKAAKNLRNKNRSRMRWLSAESSAGFDKRNTRGSGGILGEGGTGREKAATGLHNDVLLIPKNVTSERPIALMPTMIR